ncbi:MAG: polysaccharide biosynthesis tyrosine autokinase [Chitinivibrionales bacterium]|nr:polysaccharide biosynthesis tyrosine autokinase [Chitinivibrionales bacterium]MBD3395714.1 polysaccharide biosynthesis tyrosine autokinase [Chitinivibrionales bacterium]
MNDTATTNRTSGQPFTQSARLKDYLAIIVRRSVLILLSLLSVVLSTVFYVLRMDDVYESYSTMVIEQYNPLIREALQKTPRSLSFYQGILNSRTFIDMVLDSIGPEVIQNSLPKLAREGTRQDLREYIRENLQLKKTTYESFLQLTAQANTRELAYFMATIATDVFKKRCQEVESEESRQAVVEIEKQLELVRAKLEQAEHDYSSFKEKAGSVGEGTTPELQTLQEAYAKDLAQLGIKEANLKAEKEHLKKLEAMVTPTGKAIPPEVAKLRTRLKELEKEKMRLEGLGIRLSGVSTIDREINEIEKELLQYKRSSETPHATPEAIRQWQQLRKSVITKEADLELFKRRLESYRRAIANYKKDNPNILAQSLELLRLRRSKEIYENVYSFLLEKAEEERIQSASSGAGIKVVDIARMPDRPIPKNETRYYVLGVLFGLALGLGLAFLVEFNDTTLKSTEDIERVVHVPVLGTIPHIVHNKKDEIQVKRRSSKSKKSLAVTQYPRHLLNFSGSDSVTTESYRSLRTNLSFVSPDDPLRTVLVTSAGPSEGKSLTISNLAMAYAQMGKRTLLIDTDLRRPVLHHLFGVKREPGFSELFMGSQDYEKVIQPTEKENLFLLTAGMFTPNPAELIGSQKMTHHIEYFRDNFDIVFFDTPPIVAVTDAALLGTRLDGVLLVIRSHHTDREVASRAVNTLKNVGVKVLGTVLNDINLSHRYSSYGYYKYYYHYYRSKKT